MKFLIVDDAPEIIEAVSLCLELRYPGATIVSASTGEAGLGLVRRQNPDLVLLDIDLPDLDSFDLCRQIRANSQAPVVMLTNHYRDVDEARGLEAGADDYITKPFSHFELLTRVQAILQRTKSADSIPAGSFRMGDLYINFVSREMRFKEDEIKLTPTEYRLLFHLVRNAGRVISYRELHALVWGSDHICKICYLKTYVKHLRQKLEDSTTCPRLIHTEHRVGYRFAMSLQSIESP